MFIFCLLWIPLFYLFWRSVTAEGVRFVWALLLGCVMVFPGYLKGDFVKFGGFGFSLWLSGFVDIVGLPVLIPIIVCSLLVLFRFFPGNTDITGFTLLALIPSTIPRTLSRGSSLSPITLVLVPLLCTALAVGVPFFIKCIIRALRWYVNIPLGLCILALPILAVSSYWAFFAQKTTLGFLLFFPTLIPMMVSVILDYTRH